MKFPTASVYLSIFLISMLLYALSLLSLSPFLSLSLSKLEEKDEERQERYITLLDTSGIICLEVKAGCGWIAGRS